MSNGIYSLSPFLTVRDNLARSENLKIVVVVLGTLLLFFILSMKYSSYPQYFIFSMKYFIFSMKYFIFSMKYFIFSMKYFIFSIKYFIEFMNFLRFESLEKSRKVSENIGKSRKVSTHGHALKASRFILYFQKKLFFFRKSR